MTRLERLQQEITELSVDERARMGEWFAEVYGADWDVRFEADVASGKLDTIADAALASHRAGKSRAM